MAIYTYRLNQMDERDFKLEKSPNKEAKKQKAAISQSNILSYQNALEDIQKELTKLEMDLNEHNKKRKLLEKTKKQQPDKKEEISKELALLHPKLVELENQFKEKQEGLYVLQESITHLNAGKEYTPVDWEIDPSQTKILHQAYLESAKTLSLKRIKNFTSKAKLLLKCTRYLEAISIASNINLSVSQNIDDEFVQNKLDLLYHNYVKALIILTGREQSAYGNLLKEYSKKAPLSALNQEDFTQESYALFDAYRMLGEKIIGELPLNEGDSNKILRTFVTDVFAEATKNIQIDAGLLFEKIENFNKDLSELHEIILLQKQNIENLIDETEQLMSENQSAAGLNNILTEIMERTSTDSPSREINENAILAMLENSEMLFIHSNKTLNFLLKLQKEQAVRSELYDIDLLTNLYQLINKLTTYKTTNRIKHDLVNCAQKLASLPAQISEINAINTLENAALSELITQVVNLILKPEMRQEIMHLQEEYNLSLAHKKINIHFDKLERLENNHAQYQVVLRQTGQLRNELFVEPYSKDSIIKILELIKNNKSIGEDFNNIQQVKKILDETDIEAISETSQFAIKKIMKTLNKNSTLGRVVGQIFHYTEYYQLLSKNLVALEVAQGELFQDDNKEKQQDIVYTLYQSTHPLTLVDTIQHFYHTYDDNQRSNCLYFIKQYLEIDEENTLVNINFKDSKFIRNLIEFNQTVIEEDSTSVLAKKAEEINELIMSKILKKETDFNQQMHDIMDGKISPRMLARKLKTIHYDIFHNNGNIALIKDLLAEVETIVQAPNLLSEEDYVEEIKSNLENLCLYVEELQLYEDTVENIAKQFENTLENKEINITKSPTPQQIEPNELDNLIHQATVTSVDTAEYQALVDAFVDKVEEEYLKRFVSISSPELLTYALENNREKIELGLLPKAPHVRGYMLYNQLMKDYCRIMVFYDSKTK